MKANNNQTLGTIVLVIGAALLLKQLGVIFPSWLFTWPMILIAIGIAVGLKSGFRNPASLILLIVGSFFVLRRNDILPAGLESYVLPVGLIILGLVLLVGRKRKQAAWKIGATDAENDAGWGKSTTGAAADRDDVVKIEGIFSGIDRKVISKAFKGGEIVTVFGGVNIDLSHADLDGPAVLDVSVVFGGVKLIVPPHWHVVFSVTNIAAGVEDKRYLNPSAVDNEKKLVITGAAVFGGIEISSF